MKYAFALAAVAGLAAASAHAGHERFHRRADDVATVTDWTVVTVTDVVTVIGPSPTAKESSHAAAPSSPAAKPSSAAPVVSSAAPVVSSAAPVVSSAAQAATSPAPVASKPASSSAAVATPVVIHTPEAPAPEPQHTTFQTLTSPAPKPQQPATTSSPVAAAPASSSPAAAPSSAAPATGGAGGSGMLGMLAGASIPANCPKDKPCVGDMTTYTPGQGSCGYVDSDNDDIVAINSAMWGSLSNSGVNSPTNKLCDKKIQITNTKTGATAVGLIRDKCPGCTGEAGIDLSSTLMKKLNNGLADGRIPGIEWYFL